MQESVHFYDKFTLLSNIVPIHQLKILFPMNRFSDY